VETDHGDILTLAGVIEHDQDELAPAQRDLDTRTQIVRDRTAARSGSWDRSS
jgi:hypothetical protein